MVAKFGMGCVVHRSFSSSYVTARWGKTGVEAARGRPPLLFRLRASEVRTTQQVRRRCKAKSGRHHHHHRCRRRSVAIRNHFVLCRDRFRAPRRSYPPGWVSGGDGGGGTINGVFGSAAAAAQDGLIISDLDKTKGREETRRGREGAECSNRLTPANRSFSIQGGIEH